MIDCRVVVDVNDSVQVERDNFDDIVEFVKVVFPIRYESWEGN
jgi:hypothetical protein